MLPWKSPAGTVGLSVLMLIAGCTVSVQPWTKQPTAPPGPIDAPPGHPLAPASLTGAVPRPLPQDLNSPNAATSQLIRQLSDADDQRNALLNQVQSLKKQVKERDENLRVASYEMDESSKNLKRTRDEFRQWLTEMDELRDRVRKLEEYRATLKPLIEETLHYLNREKEPAPIRIPATGK